MTWLRRCVHPLGPLPVLVPALAVLVLSALETAEFWSWEYQDWPHTSSQFHEKLIFPAALAAAAATYFAGRLTQPSRIFAQASIARGGGSVVARHLGALIPLWTVAYLLGMVPLLVLTIRDAHVGGPDVLAMLTGAFGMVECIVVGYAVGVFAGSAWLAPLTFVVGFGVLRLNAATNDVFVATVPVTEITADIGRPENLPFVLYRLIFSAVVIVVAWVLASRALDRPRRWKIPSLVTASSFVAVLVLIVIPAVLTPALLAQEHDPPVRCQERDGIQYCVHQGHELELPRMSVAGAETIAAAGGTYGRFDHVLDMSARAAFPQYDLTNAAWVNLSAGSSPGSINSNMRTAIAGRLTGSYSCQQKFGLNADAESAELSEELRSWLQAQAGGFQPSEFDRYDPDTVHAWMASHQDKITSCSLTKADLP